MVHRILIRNDWKSRIRTKLFRNQNRASVAYVFNAIGVPRVPAVVMVPAVVGVLGLFFLLLMSLPLLVFTVNFPGCLGSSRASNLAYLKVNPYR
jgi:hypothetical protein